ncbi:DUF791-domain-containing protein [Hesseltinella vesiculosa]|uniref:Molybdate-anion transporter n=1 Tax=Hesseltinella vesiculosa TaxID=101127 RepID=A0A1X2GSR0_9FUNG|nr:DUF791-domain-containing protein [Hesseltinella vesiculosa]
MTVGSEESYNLDTDPLTGEASEANDENSLETQKRFKSLQYSYLTVYLTVMGSDWLQGPYLYKLYTTYGLAFDQIALLFLTGFLSGAFAGTALGSMADSWGRRKVCMLFCGTTITALCIRLWNVYPVLFLSHMLSGASTALMYSVFEAWYVAEHTARGFPAEWRSQTFGHATFLNGIVAIVAGLVANQLVDLFDISAPYIFACMLLSFAAFMISTTWTENYGEPQGTVSGGCFFFFFSLPGTNILLLGCAQTFFETSMYVFVLMYTPAIENAALTIYGYDQSSTIPLGYLFATLMFAIMTGSMVFQTLNRQSNVPNAPALMRYVTKDRLLIGALFLAGVTMLGLAYHLFEFTTGIYHPSISSLKAENIPEESRAAVMTLLRIPMNIAIAIIFWNVSPYPPFFKKNQGIHPFFDRSMSWANPCSLLCAGS